MVDYRATPALAERLANKYGNHPFQYIFDTVGAQDLFLSSPRYLDTSGRYINVGNFEGVVTAIWRSLRNRYTPLMLGGIPRRYDFIGVSPTAEKASVLARLVNEGRLKLIVEDVFKFEDVLQVSNAPP